MSIQSEIDRIKNNVAGAYSAVRSRGGTMPETQSSDKIAAAIESIPIGVTEEYLQKALSTKQDALVGESGQVVGFDTSGSAAAVNSWSNPNLLDNWYFGDPVNQRGQLTYSGIGYYIDRWRSWEADGEVTAEAGRVLVKKQIAQVIENGIKQSLNGKQVTISALLSDGMLISASGIISLNNAGIRLGVQEGNASYILFLAEDGALSIQLNTLNDALIGVEAMKMEFGPVQTLAHRDADGNWVLNDPPPNKALELLKCQKYFKRIKANNIMVPAVGYCPTNNLAIIPIQLSVPLRTNPSVRYSDLNDITIRVSGITDLIPTKITPYYTLDQQFIYGYFELDGGAPVGGAAILRIANSGYLDFDANL